MLPTPAPLHDARALSPPTGSPPPSAEVHPPRERPEPGAVRPEYGVGPGIAGSKPGLPLREISRAAAFVALAMLLPPVFHAVRLGHVFLPMVLPLLLGAFFLRPRWALAIGLLTPPLSALTTGMPPLLPPVALWMSAEVGLMALLVSMLRTRTKLPAMAILAIALVSGRLLYTALVFLTATWLELPSRMLTVAALISSWPGMLLALLVVPAAVTAVRRAAPFARPQPVNSPESP